MFFKIIAIAALSLTMFGWSTAFGQDPGGFDNFIRVQYFGEDLQNKHGTSPLFTDWDGDGDKDLIVGHHFQGQIYYYRNSGTTANPVFNSERVLMEADNAVIEYGNV